MYPYPDPGILSKTTTLLKSINWGGFLDGTQKTLGVINQAIPIFYQVKPIVNNAKTLFKIASAVNSNPTNNSNVVDTTNNNSPIFYL